MARIFRFPESDRNRQPRPGERSPAPEAATAQSGFWGKLSRDPLFMTVYGVLLMLILVTWPFLRWIVTIDLMFQLVRAMVLWDRPGVHAGLECFLHFAVVGAVGFLVLAVPIHLDQSKTGGPR